MSAKTKSPPQHKADFFFLLFLFLFFLLKHMNRNLFFKYYFIMVYLSFNVLPFVSDFFFFFWCYFSPADITSLFYSSQGWYRH